MDFQTSQRRRQGGFLDTFLQLPPRFIMQLILIILPSVNRLMQQSASSLLYSPPLPSFFLLFPLFLLHFLPLFPPLFFSRSLTSFIPLLSSCFIISLLFTFLCHFTLHSPFFLSLIAQSFSLCLFLSSLQINSLLFFSVIQSPFIFSVYSVFLVVVFLSYSALPHLFFKCFFLLSIISLFPVFLSFFATLPLILSSSLLPSFLHFFLSFL